MSLPKDSRLPLRLEELRNAKGGGRWWAVGSAFHGDALKGSGAQHGRTNTNAVGATLSSEVSPTFCLIVSGHNKFCGRNFSSKLPIASWIAKIIFKLHILLAGI